LPLGPSPLPGNAKLDFGKRLRCAILRTAILSPLCAGCGIHLSGFWLPLFDFLWQAFALGSSKIVKLFVGHAQHAAIALVELRWVMLSNRHHDLLGFTYGGQGIALLQLGSAQASLDAHCIADKELRDNSH
jgi:hypothetical protein